MFGVLDNNLFGVMTTTCSEFWKLNPEKDQGFVVTKYPIRKIVLWKM